MGNKTATRIIIVSPDPRLSEDARDWLTVELRGAEIVSLNRYASRKDLAPALTGGLAACFVDVSADPNAAQSVLAAVAAETPDALLVAILARQDPDLLLRFMRQGAAEFLIAPLTADNVRAVAAKIERPGAAGTGARTLCVVPAKGGCGASTIASHLAHEFKRLDHKRVLLADLDPLAGTLSFLLKLKSTHSFADVLLRSDEIDDDIWKAMVCHSNGVDMLLAPETLGEGMGDLSDPSTLIEFARSRYDAVLLDAGNAYGEWNQRLAALAGEVLLVTSCEFPVVYAAQRALCHFQNGGVDRDRIHLLVNRWGRDGGVSPEIVGQALEMDVLQVLPEDADSIHDALVDGKLVSPSTAFGKAIRALGEQLAGKSQPAASPDKSPSTEKAASGRSGFISLFY